MTNYAESKGVNQEVAEMFGAFPANAQQLIEQNKHLQLPNISRDIDSAIPVHVGKVPTPTMNLTPEVEEAIEEFRRRCVVKSIGLGDRHLTLTITYEEAQCRHKNSFDLLINSGWRISAYNERYEKSAQPCDTAFEEETYKRLAAIERTLSEHADLLKCDNDAIVRIDRTLSTILNEVTQKTTAMAEACAESIAKCRAEVVSPAKVLWQLLCNLIGWGLVIFCWLSGALGAWHIYVWLLNYLSR